MMSAINRRVRVGLLVACAWLVPALAQEAVPEVAISAPAPGQMPYFDVIPDPLEGFNRCAWAVNEGLFRGVLYPLSRGYAFAVPAPVRAKISNAGHNLTYPVRLVNSCLQGKWAGAWEESKRFGVNSTVGIVGLFDPASAWRIGRSDEDFGQTFGRYGAGPGFYLMLPVVGPSNGRDLLGRILDWPLDVTFWIGQAQAEAWWPLLLRPAFGTNDLSGQAGTLKRQLDSQNDPYQLLRTVCALDRQRRVLDYQPEMRRDYRPDPTVGAVLFVPQTPDYANLAVTRRVRVPATGKELPYSCWLQKTPAPVAFYIPGLGSHRLDPSTLAYADMLYRHGYSVVAISNPLQREFMELASVQAVPGYGPADVDDVVNVLRLVRDDLQCWHGERLQTSALTGVSHGAYLTLQIAARETRGELGDLAFDRYVAVNPPLDLFEALSRLDEMYNAPLAWPAAERRQRMEGALHAALFFAENGLDALGDIRLTRDESRFLIGVVFRYTLMCVIQNSQSRHSLGVLKQDPAAFVRQDAYREIWQLSYADYLDRFVLPYVIRDGRVADRAAAILATDLRQEAASLRRNGKIRVQICEDDFLLDSQNVAWFRDVFGAHLKAYPQGGHLGNLYVPAVQEELVHLFDR
jgi:ABC-type transporter lipoprotein component MlaA